MRDDVKVGSIEKRWARGGRRVYKVRDNGVPSATSSSHRPIRFSLAPEGMTTPAKLLV
jgi:hypothetical protein